MSQTQVTLRDVYAARLAIGGRVNRTPLVRSASLSKWVNANVHLKLETTQEIGAFKIRGATNRLLSLSSAERERGVVTVSTGNHGRAVAAAAGQLGVRAVVCMSSLVADHKRRAIEDLGAEICIVGQSQDEAEVEANRLVAQDAMVLVHPFDDPHVIAGQGTIGLELLEQIARIDTLVVGLSGGGLLSGIALALKAAWADTRVVAVSMERGAAMFESVQAGRPVVVEEEPTLADSLGGGIGLHNRHTFEMVRSLTDDYVLLSEPEIATGMIHLYRNERVIAEGAGAVAVAALLSGRVLYLRGNVVCMVSGGNVDMEVFDQVIQRR